MKRVIISGAAGFLGLATTKEFLDQGYIVYALVRPGSGHNKRLYDLPGALFPVELECEDYSRIKEVISDKCDLFVHLVSFGARDDFKTQKTNMEYCIKALESAAITGCSRYICVGTQAEIGLSDKIMYEDIVLDPISAYGAAKASALYLTRYYAKQLGIDWVWGRIFSLYGECAPPESLIPNLISKLKSNEDIYLSSCEHNWDYLNTSDAAKALVCLAEKGHSGEIYNIAGGDYKPLKKYIESARNLFDYKGTIHYGTRIDPYISLQPDISKIYEHTGWKPIIKFEEGIRKLANEEN